MAHAMMEDKEGIMSVCDLCSVPLGADATRYSSAQIKKAVRTGLRPDSTVFELSAAFGMSKGAAEQAWLQRVMTDKTDWLLCPACSAKCASFVSNKKWWQFWKK
jgi:hypothetical protein